MRPGIIEENMFETGYQNYAVLANKFELFHKDPTNVFFHFLTTPIGLVGFLGLLLHYFLSRKYLAILSICYIVSLLPIVNFDVYIGSLLLWGIIVFVALKLKLRPFYSIVFILIGYFGQDLSHYLTGEKTFQSSYTKSDYEIDLNTGWLMTFLEHTYFLVPLCIHVVLPLCTLDICRQTAAKSSALSIFFNLNVSEQLFIIIPLLIALGTSIWFSLPKHSNVKS